MSQRLIALDGVFNFRDFGGYDVKGGGSVRRGALFRSAHLARSTETDRDRVHALGIRVVADLRRPAEREAEPSRWHESAAHRVIASAQGQSSDLPPHMQFLRDTDDLSPHAVRGYMMGTYERVPYERRHIELFSDLFAALVDGESPVLVHCAAGKDRTGVLCALVLESLGVSREDIFADYELTNASVNVDGLLKQATARFAKRINREIDAETLRPMVGVDRVYLERAFSTIEERSGSLGAYLENTLGVGPDQRRALGDHLLEPV